MPLSTDTESYADILSILLSNGNVALYLELCISITTANEFAFNSIGFANSKVWYPALTVSDSPDFNVTSCKSFFDLLVPLGFTYTLHLYVSGAYKETCVKYSVFVVFYQIYYITSYLNYL